ncbi:MAG: hypothetical protein K0Q95_2349 [Bacteroidota bacterium]|jgi:hypothetical protein|nr:hypothetical protein [Bacteroidota bacterium]
MKKIFKSLFILIFTLACKGQEKEMDNTDFSYQVTYNENTDSTTVLAMFYEPLKPIVEKDGMTGCRAPRPKGLAKGSRVSFNGVLLDQTSPFQYRKIFIGLVKAGEFVWEDANSNKQRNRVEAPSRIAIPHFDEFNVNYELSFRFIGDQIKKSEWIAFTIQDSQGKLFPAGSRYGNEVFYPVNQTYGAGPALFSLERTIRNVIREGSKRKGEINVTYVAKTVHVKIVTDEQLQKRAKSKNPY